MQEAVTDQKNWINKGNMKAVAKYAMLPGIIPRIRALGFHFGHFAYLLALVFSSARLIPVTHPMTNPRMIGQFGVRDVLAFTANNIKWSWKNTDQIAIFCAVVLGLIMIALQTVLIAVFALSGTAHAADSASFFSTPNPDTDISFIFLSQVFGSELNLFGSGGGVLGTSDNPIHSVLGQMLALYSMATMVIAVIIVLYYILTVVGEAAKTGTPFGQRFNSLWAPIRLVVALGLLVPLGSGYNSAQYVTLWMAKMGSGLGTQVWLELADVMKVANPTKYNIKLDGELWLHDMVGNAFVSAVCAKAHTDHENGTVTWARMLQGGSTSNSFSYAWVAPSSVPIHRRNCGSVGVSFPEGQANVGLGVNVFGLQERESPVPSALLLAKIRPVIEQALIEVEEVAETYRGGLDDDDTMIELSRISIKYTTKLTEEVNQVYENQVASNLNKLLEGMDDKGWLYAGVWYAQINRTMQSAYQQRTKSVPGVIIPQRYTNPDSPTWWAKLTGSYDGVDARVVAAHSMTILYKTNAMYGAAKASLEETYDKSCFGKTDLGAELPILEKLQCVIASVFVPEQLTALSKNPTYDPMGVMVTAGGTILSRAYELALYGFGAKTVGGILSGIPIIGGLGTLSSEIGGMLLTIAFVGFGAGIVLFFLLPIFPFMYFFFAVIAWVMEIFEAIIAMPLWALAHLKIDGDGMPGGSAINGYHLLLAILLRPALIIFGLIGSSLVFFAAIFALQMLFTPLLDITREENLFGLEIMIFTVIFAYMAYMIGLSCFKMVDTIPNSILRWLGSGAQTFSDNKEDAVHGSQGAFLGGAVMAQNMAGGIGGIGGGLGQGLGGAIKGASDNKMQKSQEELGARRHQELVASGGGNTPQPAPQSPSAPQSPPKSSGDGSGGYQGKTKDGFGYTSGNAYKPSSGKDDD